MTIQTTPSTARIIAELGLKTQHLITRCLEKDRLNEARQLQLMDGQLSLLWLHRKMLGRSTRYIWHSQDDSKVRPAHSVNNGKTFGWDALLDTGHPGEEYNCRCWAEPLGDSHYARQLLITPINDSPNKWNNWDFVRRYMARGGEPIMLSEAGYLGDVIEYYATQAVARDGTVGVYKAVERQVLEKAKQVGSGGFIYSFAGNYNFQHDVLFSLGDSVIRGVFDGEVRKEGEFLVVSGIITYDFSDEFGDPTSRVETLMEEEGISREEAEARVGDSGGLLGVPYAITDNWQTKFNGAVKQP